MPNDMLFDTSAVIDIYKGRERIRPQFEQLLSNNLNVYLSVITEAELWRGLRTGELDKHHALVSQFNVLPLNSAAARLAGGWMQTYKNNGLGWMDALIAATAAVVDVSVLTRDKRLVALLENHVSFILY